MVIKFIKGSPKNSTLRKKNNPPRHQARGGGDRFNYPPKNTPWSLIKNEEGATRILQQKNRSKWFYYTLLPFLPFDFLKTVPWCSLCQRVFGMECCLSQALLKELKCLTSHQSPMNYHVFLRFLPTNPNWLVTHQLHRPWSHQTIGAHARQCATALGACWGWSFFIFLAFKSSKLADDSS